MVKAGWTDLYDKTVRVSALVYKFNADQWQSLRWTNELQQLKLNAQCINWCMACALNGKQVVPGFRVYRSQGMCYPVKKLLPGMSNQTSAKL